MAVKTKRSRPVPSAPVAALATIPAGPQLGAALAELDPASLSGFDTVLVLKARNRQSNHERGLLVATVAEVMRRKDPGYGLHDDTDSWDEVGMHEIRAALMLTRRSANSLCGLARDLAVRLPTVLAAMTDGLLDQARARVFSSWTGELADPHAHALVGRLLPIAPTLTTAQLIDAIQRAAINLDPHWARRRYERAITARRIIGVLGHDGTATLTGEHLPADQVAAICDRLDAIARHLKRHGHPDRIDHIRADIYLGLLDGSYSGMTETQLLDHLIATMPPPPHPTTPNPRKPDPREDAGEPDVGEPDVRAHNAEPDTGLPDGRKPDPGEPGAGTPDAGKPDAGKPDAGKPDAGKPDAGEPDAAAPDPGEATAPEPDQHRDGQGQSAPQTDAATESTVDDQLGDGGNANDSPEAANTIEDSARSNTPFPARSCSSPDTVSKNGTSSNGASPNSAASDGAASDGAASDGAASDGATSDGAGIRGRGLRLLVGLSTIAGRDQRCGDLLGYGPVHAELARRISAAPRASWYYVLVEADGTPRDVGPIRGRPARPWADGSPPGYQRVEVWLHLTVDELTQLVDQPPPGWQHLIADLAHRIANSPGGAPNGDPRDRLPGAALRRWICIRDRQCVFPGCRVAPHRCEADHTIEHACGGPTIDTNLANACKPDHTLRHKHGWTVHQPRPGHIVWTSPLGHNYERTPPPAPGRITDPMPHPTHPDEDRILIWVSDDDTGWEHDSCLSHAPAPLQPKPEAKPEPEPQPPPQPAIPDPADDIPPF